MADSNALIERTRLVGTVIDFKCLPKGKQKVVKYAPDDESNWSTMKNLVVFGNLRSYHTGQPLTEISQVVMYAEGKVALRAENKLFIGNTVAFDASIVFDKSLQMYKLNRAGNFCGRSVRWLGFIDDAKRLLPNVEFSPFGDSLCCGGCSHYSYRDKSVKPTCKNNIFIQ